MRVVQRGRGLAVRLTAALAALLALNAQPAPAAPLDRVAPESVGLSSARLERLTAFLRNDIAEVKIPGAVMLVARHGKVAYLEALGRRDLKSPAPMPIDALFRLGSMSKPVTIMAALSLIEEGKFRLTTPIVRFLPQFAHLQVATERKDPATGAVTLELAPADRLILIGDLLRHTDGLTYETAGDTKLKLLYREAGIGAPGEKLVDRVDRLARMPLAYQPGTVWEYGRGVDLLSRIVELVTGLPLHEALHARVLDPLDMRDTDYWVPPEKRARLAGFAPSRTGRERPPTDLTRPPEGESGATGLVATATDYARLLQTLLDGGRLGAARVLSRKTIELMTTDQLGPEVRTGGPSYFPGPGYGYGYGFAVRRTLVGASELGSVGNYLIEGIDNTFAFVDPKEDLLAVLMVQAYDWLWYRPMIMDLVEQAIVD
jgi:CubicO group peptidase (beta-lactamase class C family)